MGARLRTGADFDRLGNVWGLGGPDDQERLAITTRFIEKHIPGPTVVIEVGALRGALTEKLLTAFPRAALHLIEIAPSHAAVLRERFAENPRVAVHQADMLSLPDMPIPPADAVLLIECLYYLDRSERRTFVEALERCHPEARVIVSTPVTGGVYFTEPELRQLFGGYRLAGVEVTMRLFRSFSGWTSRAMRLAKRFRVEKPVTRFLRHRIADHAIYALVPGVGRRFARRGLPGRDRSAT